MSIERFVFIYAKDGKIRCLTADHRQDMLALQDDGWKHTATLNTVFWIEALVNGEDAAELINELKGVTND